MNQTAGEIAIEYKRLSSNWINQYIQLVTIRPFDELQVHVRAINAYGALAEVWHNVDKLSKSNDYIEGDPYEDR